MFNKKLLKRKIILVIILLFLVFPKVSHAQASPPWPDLIGHFYGEMLREIDRSIYGAIMGSLKQAAAEMINDTVSNLISGSSTSGALFITDWKSELFYKPLEGTTAYMDNWFKSISSGKGNSTNFLSNGQGEGIQGSYTKQLEQQARATLSPKEPPPCSISNPSNMFNEGNWKMFDSFISNPNCNVGLTLRAQEQAMNDYDQRKTEAIVRAIAYQGYKAQEEGGDKKGGGGKVTTPGSTIKDIQSNVEDLGNKILAGANTIPEVITSIVTKIATKAIQQGIGNAQRNIQKEINNVTNGLNKEINNAIKNPQDIFKSMY